MNLAVGCIVRRENSSPVIKTQTLNRCDYLPKLHRARSYDDLPQMIVIITALTSFARRRRRGRRLGELARAIKRKVV